MNRRSFVRAAASALSALGLTAAAVSIAEAVPCPPGQARNRKGDCRCPAGTNPCPTGCFDLLHDAANCGACGHVCPTGATCRKGECRCPYGFVAVGGACALAS